MGKLPKRQALKFLKIRTLSPWNVPNALGDKGLNLASRLLIKRGQNPTHSQMHTR